MQPDASASSSGTDGKFGSRVRRWRIRDLADFTSTPSATVTRSLVPAMVAASVLARRGRFWYGRGADIDAWLLGQWNAPTAQRGARGGR